MTLIKPELVLVKFDETRYWSEDIQKKAGKIFFYYIVNLSEITFCCSLTPSYWLEFAYGISENRLEDDDDDNLVRNGGEDNQSNYYDIGSIEKHIVWRDTLDENEIFEDDEDIQNYINRVIDRLRGTPIE